MFMDGLGVSRYSHAPGEFHSDAALLARRIVVDSSTSPHYGSARKLRRRDGIVAKRSVAETSSWVMPGSKAEWPASGTMRSWARGQARCSSQAILAGQSTS